MAKKLSKKLWEKIKKDFPAILLQQPEVISAGVDKEKDRIFVEMESGLFYLTRKNFKPTKK